MTNLEKNMIKIILNTASSDLFSVAYTCSLFIASGHVIPILTMTKLEIKCPLVAISAGIGDTLRSKYANKFIHLSNLNFSPYALHWHHIHLIYRQIIVQPVQSSTCK